MAVETGFRRKFKRMREEGVPIGEGRLFERGRLFEEIRFTAEFYHGKETTVTCRKYCVTCLTMKKKTCLKFDQM